MSRTVPAGQRQISRPARPGRSGRPRRSLRFGPLSRAFLRRAWLPVFAAFALLAVAWSLAMPADGTTDERQHLERAYGAVTGHLLAHKGEDPLVHRPGAAFKVPKSLLPPNALCVYFPNVHQDQSWVARSASCQHPAPATQAKVRVVSWVGRYNPLYYLAVGGPLRFWPTMKGILLSRILAALLASAFAAAAAAVAIRTRRPLLLAAVLTVLTPTVIALNSTVNPNGIEISAAVLLWVCLVDLVRPGSVAGSGSAMRLPQSSAPGQPRRVRDAGEAARLPRAYSSTGILLRLRRAFHTEPGSATVASTTLLALAAVSGAVVLTVRAEGPFWFALALAGSLAVAERGRVRQLLRRRAVRLVAAGWAVVGGLAMAWNVVSGNNKVTTTLIAVHPADHRVSTLLRVIAVDRVGGWFTEAFALDVQAPWVPMLWAVLAAAVLVPLAMLRSRRVVVVALAVAAASLGITVVLEIKFLGTLGWSQYGRYFLPGLAGTAVLLASGPVTELPPVLRRRVPRLFAVGAAVCQLWVLAVEMTRVQAGPKAPLNPLGGSWHPAVGSLAVLAVAALGAALLVAVVWAATAAIGTEAATGTGTGTATGTASEPTAAAVTLSAARTTVPPTIASPAEPQVVPEPANS